MKLSKLTLIAICAFALVFAACGGASTETSKTNPTDAGNTAVATTPAQTETATKTAAAVKQSTPGEAGEAFINAVKAKDKAAFKNSLSQDSLEILNLAAQKKKMTMDDLLDKEFFVHATMPAKLEQRNEKITGDKATIEMKEDNGKWSPMTFVKEAGAWKVSLE